MCSQEAELPDWEPMPDPEPVAQATADEAACTILSQMVDLYEDFHSGNPDYAITYMILAGYILYHTEARNFLATQPAITNELRNYTNLLLTTCASAYQICTDLAAIL